MLINPGEIRRLDATAALACAAIHETGFLHPWPETEFSSLLQSPQVYAEGIFLAGEAQEPIALAGFALSRLAFDEAEILTIAVAPALRGRGLGHAVLSAHLADLAAAGAAMLFLEVDVENKPARALYARQGFRQVGERKAYYRKADGSFSTALILRKDFSEPVA
ncbi:GNAT family N-acetyltransferase [Beijerinckia indica]|uniref:GCN5-related N-acetyltransferase n=1 Tax=Beijerinckia indica subsp. indica (strain ATCC 9039 / DSM 1715 / NCIMB 8712) TaxID=395963 RepID=B2IIK3_BEII9|nr:GNAT family N-acetyltransferase [Beijerinckia indica]ACB94696.1 GCN5-related N-acetyltransferase [Beijerinckia indica subsp. indica ATCC 9039]